MLRRSIGEPILDLVRRIIDVNGIDVELASSVSPAAPPAARTSTCSCRPSPTSRRSTARSTLPALLAWLDAEDEFGQGLDIATPSEADSVKLLTVHRAKGLEWDAVFLVGVVKDKFPANRGRSSWLKSPEVMPAALRGDARDLPQLAGHGADAIADLKERRKQHEQVEELRLAYVAWTRARHHHAVSCWRCRLRT